MICGGGPGLPEVRWIECVLARRLRKCLVFIRQIWHMLVYILLALCTIHIIPKIGHS